MTITEGVTLGDNAVIEPYCYLGVGEFTGDNRLVIGDNAHIRSHSIIYLDSRIGDNFLTGHNVMILGRSKIGNNVVFGTSTELEGNLTVGDFVITYNNVHLCHYSTTGDFVWIFPFTTLTNDPTPPSVGDMGPVIEDYAVICTNTTLLPGVRVGRDALIGAHTAVNRDVPELALAIGSPMVIKGKADRIKLRDSGKPAYPWRRHFHDRYPDEIVRGWKKEFPDG